MKIKFLLILSFFGYCSIVFGQLSIATNLREDGVYNDSKSNWDIESEQEGMTVFVFSPNFKYFRHITNSISSLYTIISYTYKEEEILYEMEVESDAGNKYDVLVDGQNMFVIFFYYDKDERYRMVRHTIEDSWYDDETDEK